MDIVLTHETALSVIRQASFPRYLSTKQNCSVTIPNRMPTPAEVQAARNYSQVLTATPEVWNVLLKDKNARHASSVAIPHVRECELPEGSFVQLAPVCVVVHRSL